MADVLDEAKRLYVESLDALREQRTQIEEDIEFSDPSDPQQWDDTIRRSRENDPGGKRPCLVMDQLGQYIAQVAGQVEQQPPSIHAIPVGGGSDKKAAEQIDGRFRHIEHASRASMHYTRAMTSAARCGVGYIIVRPEYTNRPLRWQEPRISSEPDALRVVYDPWSTETDGSDATFGYLVTPMSLSQFKKRWPGKAATDFGDDEIYRGDDSRRSVLLAEQWYQEDKTETILIYRGQDGEEQSGTEDEYHAASQSAGVALDFLRSYKDKTTLVRWRRMSGSDVLEECTNQDGTVGAYPADSIGIVPIYGYVSFVGGRMRYCGIARRGRSPQQAYNYHVSEITSHIATSPRSPWLVSRRAVKGVETLWEKANAESRAFLPWNDIDAEGPVTSPHRMPLGVDTGSHEAGAMRAIRDIQAALGMYQANLGAPSNETSGVAIESRKQQGEASNAHFPSHLAASIAQVGRIVMQMDAKLADTKRPMPIMGIDGTAGSIENDPDQQESCCRTDHGLSVNLRRGEYAVRVVVGASYSTQRTQTNAAFAEIMRGNKEMAPTVAPFWAQTLDFPGSDKFAQALAAMAPPPVKAILQPEDGEKTPDPAELSQKVAELSQALQEAIKHARDAQQDADQAIETAADAKRTAEVRERELDIQAYNAETARLKVTGANELQIQSIVESLVANMRPEPLPDEMPDEVQEQPQDMPQDIQEPDIGAEIPQVAADQPGQIDQMGNAP